MYMRAPGAQTPSSRELAAGISDKAKGLELEVEIKIVMQLIGCIKELRTTENARVQDSVV